MWQKQLLVFWTSGKAGSACKSLWRMRDALENVLKLGCFKGVPGRGNWKAIVEQLLLEMEVKGKKTSFATWRWKPQRNLASSRGHRTLWENYKPLHDLEESYCVFVRVHLAPLWWQPSKLPRSWLFLHWPSLQLVPSLEFLRISFISEL